MTRYGTLCLLEVANETFTAGKLVSGGAGDWAGSDWDVVGQSVVHQTHAIEKRVSC